jgi:hypothetical protein
VASAGWVVCRLDGPPRRPEIRIDPVTTSAEKAADRIAALGLAPGLG